MLKATVRLNSRIREVKAEGNAFCFDFIEIMGNEVTDRARENVRPGVGIWGIGGGGPGPHPHATPHEDTGDLMRSIRTRTRQRGFMFEALTETDIDYGVYLELGWTASNGAFYRYPWLMPAVDEARQEWEPIARTTADRSFSGG